MDSAGFKRLAIELQRWCSRQGWAALRPIQEAAIDAILGCASSVLLSANTAAGKTEAALLPIFSRMVEDTTPSLCLFASPLRALINDQDPRLRGMAETVGIDVFPWHGEISQSRKRRFEACRTGVLIITPESLEAMLLRHGYQAAFLFEHLKYVVIDEFHAFIGNERGRQLRSLIRRLEVVLGRDLARIALSATLGDMNLAAQALVGERWREVVQLDARDDHQRIEVSQSGFLRTRPQDGDDDESGGLRDLVGRLIRDLDGTSNLVYPNSRASVEAIVDAASRLEAPTPFLPHHGSLSKDIRKHAESKLKDKSCPAIVVATTTLELGIDVGAVESIALVGNAPSVASMRQRLGRSGRTEGKPAILRTYITEEEHAPDLPMPDVLRTKTVQAIAMTELMLDGWVEPPNDSYLDYSTLVQQIVSLVAQYGGLSARRLWTILCDDGPFRVDTRSFMSLLCALGEHQVLRQTGDGDLILDLRGERLIAHWDFYAAFSTPEEYDVRHRGLTLGSLPPHRELEDNPHIAFAGNRWEVMSVDRRKKVILVKPDTSGSPPAFFGQSIPRHDRVLQKMRAVYTSDHVPDFLDPRAAEFLQEGRAAFHEIGLERRQLVETEPGCLFFGWRGDRAMETLVLLLKRADVQATYDGIRLGVACSLRDFVALAERLVADGLPSPEELAAGVRGKLIGKHDRFLPEELLNENWASGRLDLPGAEAALRSVRAPCF